MLHVQCVEPKSRIEQKQQQKAFSWCAIILEMAPTVTNLLMIGRWGEDGGDDRQQIQNEIRVEGTKHTYNG